MEPGEREAPEDEGESREEGSWANFRRVVGHWKALLCSKHSAEAPNSADTQPGSSGWGPGDGFKEL